MQPFKGSSGTADMSLNKCSRRGVFAAGMIGLGGWVLHGCTTATPDAATSHMKPGHIALLGDSIFDNKRYVGSDPAVIDQVRAAIPDRWAATLLAVDGDFVGDVRQRLSGMAVGTSHLVLSVGGNDALGHLGVLTGPAQSREEVFLQLERIQSSFAKQYENLVDHLASLGHPLAICTIYDPNFEREQERLLAKPALTIFNDVITRTAFSRGVDLIDLRLLFREPADYANPIEPSAKGGKKLAAAIARWTLLPESEVARVIA